MTITRFCNAALNNFLSAALFNNDLPVAAPVLLASPTSALQDLDPMPKRQNNSM